MIVDRSLNKALFLIQLTASFLVVAGHYTATVFDYVQPTFWLLALNQLSRYGTVLLAIITGFFTARTFDNKDLRASKYFSGKIKYIFIPFLLSGFLYHYLLFYEIPTSFDAIINIFLGKTGGHLYFVFMLCQYYLFAYLFRNIISKKNILFLIGLFLIMQYGYINFIHASIVRNTNGFLGLSTRHLFPAWIFTFYMGHLIYWYRNRIFVFMKQHQSLLITFTILMSLSATYFVLSSTIYSAVHLIFVFSSILALVVAAVFFLEIGEFIKIRFRKGLTLYIYLLHSAVLIMLNRIFVWKFNMKWIFGSKATIILYLAVVYLGTLLISLGIVKFIQYLESGGKKKQVQMDLSQS